MFWPRERKKEDLDIGEYQLSRIVNKFTMFLRFDMFKVGTIQKRKADKVQLVDLGISDGSKPRGILD